MESSSRLSYGVEEASEHSWKPFLNITLEKVHFMNLISIFIDTFSSVYRMAISKTKNTILIIFSSS